MGDWLGVVVGSCCRGCRRSLSLSCCMGEGGLVVVVSFRVACSVLSYSTQVLC
jgi:hypothetical protein